MKLKATSAVLIGLVMPSIVLLWGAKMAEALTIGCSFGDLFFLAPCWLINSLLIALSSAFFLDIIMYVMPKIKKSKRLKYESFLIRITKANFEKRLDEFVNEKDDDILLPPSMLEWRILERRKTGSELSRDGLTNKNIITHDIEKADFIKLVNNQYHGLVIEMESKPHGLLVSVDPKGEEVSNTKTVEMEIKKRRKTTKQIGFQHIGFTHVSVDNDAYLALLKWLYKLQEESK